MLIKFSDNDIAQPINNSVYVPLGVLIDDFFISEFWLSILSSDFSCTHYLSVMGGLDRFRPVRILADDPDGTCILCSHVWMSYILSSCGVEVLISWVLVLLYIVWVMIIWRAVSAFRQTWALSHFPNIRFLSGSLHKYVCVCRVSLEHMLWVVSYLSIAVLFLTWYDIRVYSFVKSYLESYSFILSHEDAHIVFGGV